MVLLTPPGGQAAACYMEFLIIADRSTPRHQKKKTEHSDCNSIEPLFV